MCVYIRLIYGGQAGNEGNMSEFTHDEGFVGSLCSAFIVHEQLHLYIYRMYMCRCRCFVLVLLFSPTYSERCQPPSESLVLSPVLTKARTFWMPLK